MKDYECVEIYHSPPPLTPEDAEDELIALAMKRAKERLEDGTASNQLIAEILRHGTTSSRLQKEKLRKENALLEARTEAVKAQKHTEEFYAKVMDAFHSYGPQFFSQSYEDDDYDDYDE